MRRWGHAETSHGDGPELFCEASHSLGIDRSPRQAPSAIRSFVALSIGMRTFMACARSNPVGRATVRRANGPIPIRRDGGFRRPSQRGRHSARPDPLPAPEQGLHPAIDERIK